MRSWLRIDDTYDTDEDLQLALDAAEKYFCVMTGRDFAASPPTPPETIAVYALANHYRSNRDATTAQQLHNVPLALKAIIVGSSRTEV